jgi:hypothetical protein
MLNNILLAANVVVATVEVSKIAYEGYLKYKGAKEGKAVLQNKDGENFEVETLQVKSGPTFIQTTDGLVEVKARVKSFKDRSDLVKGLIGGARLATALSNIKQQINNQ